MELHTYGYQVPPPPKKPLELEPPPHGGGLSSKPKGSLEHQNPEREREREATVVNHRGRCRRRQPSREAPPLLTDKGSTTIFNRRRGCLAVHRREREQTQLIGNRIGPNSKAISPN